MEIGGACYYFVRSWDNYGTIAYETIKCPRFAMLSIISWAIRL
jgi:hypothetical protein